MATPKFEYIITDQIVYFKLLDFPIYRLTPRNGAHLPTWYN